MRKLLMTTLAAAAILSACSDKSSEVVEPGINEGKIETGETTNPSMNLSDPLAARFNKFKAVTMDADTSFLSESERAVVNKLIEASQPLSEIYMLQLNAENPAIRQSIVNSDAKNKALLLQLFDLHFGPCDTLEAGAVFYGDTPCPKGGGFYPADMTKEEFESWINANPDDAESFKSGYTIIRRDGDGLVAIPYSEAYKPQVTKVARILREAADLSEEPTLKRFLRLRAKSLMSDDYFESEMAWMDLEGNIDVAIGPYEVYDDQLFGYKTAFEMFLTIKNPEESAALAKYKDYLRDMEANLPVEERYKNFDRGFESPIIAAYQIQGGGDNVPGVQTIAFNLPNDERVREAKGAKKVILNNVLGAKYDLILAPIGKRVLVPKQAALTVKKYMANNTLFHELSHSLGPGNITIDGRETSVNAELKELSSGLEEGKADVMGIYNILYMMERGELPVSEKESLFATYFSGLFRSVRFGTDAAHAKGAAIQYSYYRETGAVSWDEKQQRFKINHEVFEQAVSDLTGMFIRIQGNGDYEAAKAFLDKYAKLDAEAKIILNDLDGIPYDIRPIYPKGI
ncbi:MAG: hypothetical protein HKN36_12910 [Hellea sp.]|nr:hypothetical protein [Hellea sp.]